MKKLVFLALIAVMGTVIVMVRKKPVVLPTVAPPKTEVVYPIDNFINRITKKPFGIYVTPQNSPVTPERFTGYHTGVDVEYGDVAGEVEVRAMAAGKVIFSGRVNGYGGFVAMSHHLKSGDYISVYGHLKPSSLVGVGTQVSQGQSIAVLGKGYSTETDGERKHLHFGIIKGDKLDFRGYVQNQSELSLWENPVDFFQR